MRTISETRRFVILSLLISLLAGLSVFIVVSAISHHVALAGVSVVIGVLAIGVAWLPRRVLFFGMFFGGMILSAIGWMMLLYAGLYVELMAAIVVTFVGGILLSILVMGRHLLRAHRLSPAQQHREYQKLIQSILDKAP